MKTTNNPNLSKILSVLYVIVSLVTMAIFFFYSYPRGDEYTGINSIALWGVVLSVAILVALGVCSVVNRKK